MALTAEDIQKIIHEGVPMARWIGFRVDAVEADCVHTRIEYRDGLERPGGTLSGPVMMALADASMYAMIMARLGRVEMAVTANLNINFLQRPQPTDLCAEASLLKLGQRLAFCEVTLFSDGAPDQPVAHVTGSYVLPSPTRVSAMASSSEINRRT